MGHFTTHKTAFAMTLAAAAFALTLAASDSIALEATEIGPGPAGQGVSPALTGKGEGPWAKAGSTLRRVFAAHAAHQQAGGGRPFDPGNPSIRYANGLILIDAVATGDGAALLEDLRGLGLKGGTQYGAVVSGRIPLGLLDRVVGLESLRGVSASLKPETNSSADSTFGLVHDRRGAIAMNLIQDKDNPEAEDAGYTGNGVKVGVLSDTFDKNVGAPATNADDDFANGDLPGGAAPYVALHVPGNADVNDASSFGATGTAGSNTTAGDATHWVNLPASVRFNPSSFYEDPITAEVVYPDAAQYTIGSKPFTIEMWARFETTSTDGLGPVLASHYNSSAQRSWLLIPRGPGDTSPDTLIFWASPDGGSANAESVGWPWAPAVDTWYHIAVSRDDNNDVRAFIDGQQIGTPQALNLSIFDSAEDLRISSYLSAVANNRPFDGWIEDFRFVVGEALYTENFTVPTAPLASELPPPPTPVATTTVLQEGNSKGIDEGRAMMQLIHDVAPDASLSFHSAFIGLADFAQGILDLADDSAGNGADVIVDDIIYFAEPMFQDGIVAQAVDTVVSQGVAYFSSAGNSAQKSYESPFVSSGEPLQVGSEERGTLHDFNAGAGQPDYMQSVTIPVGTTFTAVLQWDQPFASNCGGCPGPTNDADIYLVDDQLQIITSSISDNLSTGEPVEIIQFANPGMFFGTDFHIMITHYDVPTGQHPQPGSPPTLMKYVWFGQSTITINEHTTDSPTSYGHANAAGAAAVGAAFYLETPAFGFPIPELEGYSSQGGVPILFDKLGNPIIAEFREKPEFVAPDGTNTTFFYSDTSLDNGDETVAWPNFFGTSAAAPHAAAIAALMLEANPSLLPADIYSILEDTAIDMGDQNVLDPFDNDTGYGLIDAGAALTQATGGNLTPVAVDDSASADQNTLVSIPVLANDALGNQPTTITLPSPNSIEGGTVTVNNGGTPSDPSDDKVDYTPFLDDAGPDSFTYTITDDDGESSVATVNVTVNVVDVQPVAASDSPATNEDVSAIVDVMANDDPLGNLPTTITAVGPGMTGSNVSTNGSTITYQPAPDYAGDDTFPYTITDDDGDQSTANVFMTIIPVNDAPTFNSNPINKPNAVAGDPYTGQTLAGGATDLEGNGLTYSWVSGPIWLSVALNGDLSGTPADTDAGVQNFFTVRVTDDGSPSGFNDTTLSIFVEAAAAGPTPTAVNDTAAAVDEDSILANHAVLGNDDFGGDGPGTVPLALGAVSGGIAAVNDGGTPAIQTDDTIDFTPAANFNGNATVQYTIEDSTGDQSTATLTIPVNPINDDPVAAADADTTNEDIAVIVDVLGNDTDVDGITLTVTAVTQGTNGTVTNNGTNVTYTPNSNTSGGDSFTYTVSDGNGGSAIGTVDITVNAINDDPVAVDDNESTNEDTLVTTANVLTNDTDIDGGALSISSADGASANGGTVTNHGDGTFDYTPVSNFNGADSFNYTVSDGNGGSDTGTVNITVNAVNDPPVAIDDNAATDQDVAVVIDVRGNDSDPDGDTLSISVVTQGANGSVTNTDANVTYTPDPGTFGPDSFTYTVSDSNGGFDTATVNVTVNEVTGPPTDIPTNVSATNLGGGIARITWDDSNANEDGFELEREKQAGNGSWKGTTLLGPVAAQTYDDASGKGTFHYRVRAVNGSGASDWSAWDDVVVSSGGGNAAPTASYTYSCTGLDCGFNGSGSTDSDGTIASYSWDFGDGSPTDSSATPNHVYAAAGSYTVILTVTDDLGANGQDSQNVTVTDVAGIMLSANGYKVQGSHTVDLFWGGAAGADVDIYRGGALIITTANDGAYTDSTGNKGGGSYVYEICEAGTATCSNTVNVNF